MFRCANSRSRRCSATLSLHLSAGPTLGSHALLCITLHYTRCRRSTWTAPQLSRRCATFPATSAYKHDVDTRRRHRWHGHDSSRCVRCHSRTSPHDTICNTEDLQRTSFHPVLLLGCLHQKPLSSAGREHRRRGRPCDRGALRCDGRGGSEHGVRGARAAARQHGPRGTERRDFRIRRASCEQGTHGVLCFRIHHVLTLASVLHV